MHRVVIAVLFAAIVIYALLVESFKQPVRGTSTGDYAPAGSTPGCACLWGCVCSDKPSMYPAGVAVAIKSLSV